MPMPLHGEGLDYRSCASKLIGTESIIAVVRELVGFLWAMLLKTTCGQRSFHISVAAIGITAG
jgi:hypothetical protein